VPEVMGGNGSAQPVGQGFAHPKYGAFIRPLRAGHFLAQGSPPDLVDPFPGERTSARVEHEAFRLQGRMGAQVVCQDSYRDLPQSLRPSRMSNLRDAATVFRGYRRGQELEGPVSGAADLNRIGARLGELWIRWLVEGGGDRSAEAARVGAGR
jgi:hypothetical protein